MPRAPTKAPWLLFALPAIAGAVALGMLVGCSNAAARERAPAPSADGPVALGPDEQQPDERGPEEQGPEEQGPEGHLDGPPATDAQPVRTAGAGSAFKTFPAVSLAGLSDLQKAAFVQLANEEICPCDCPKSWGACLQEGSRCRPAVLLAEWLVGQLADGVEPEILAEQVTQEIAGFSSKPREVVLGPYAKKGAKTPKYTVVEYADFECAHCKLASSTVSELVEKHGDRVQVVYKHFPLSFHAMARPAAAAAEAAGEQGKFWEMHDAVFATQNMLDDELLGGHARALGLDVARWQKDRASARVQARVDDSRKEGEALGVEATPTFLVNGRPFNLMRTLEAFELRFAMEDARKASSCQ